MDTAYNMDNHVSKKLKKSTSYVKLCNDLYSVEEILGVGNWGLNICFQALYYSVICLSFIYKIFVLTFVLIGKTQ